MSFYSSVKYYEWGKNIMTEDKTTVLQWLEHHFLIFFIKLPNQNTKKGRPRKKNQQKKPPPKQKTPQKNPYPKKHLK